METGQTPGHARKRRLWRRGQTPGRVRASGWRRGQTPGRVRASRLWIGGQTPGHASTGRLWTKGQTPGHVPPGQRVVVVLGYSDGGAGVIHPVCAARLARAAELATGDDVVVLSGWSRVPGRRSEAELMADAWSGAARELVLDPDASTTAENAANAIRDVLRARADQVVVVTSRWHAARARAAFRWLLRGQGVRVLVATPDEAGCARDRLRELALWPLLPAQLSRAAHARPNE
jgi:uncharacterized SAM-binding protein YcdF (DUF218 family)